MSVSIPIARCHDSNHNPLMNTTTETTGATASNLVGQTVHIGRRVFTITFQDDTADQGRPMYMLTGVRGAEYVTSRNVNRPGRMFLVHSFRSRRGFGIPSGLENTWLIERSGTLEVI